MCGHGACMVLRYWCYSVAIVLLCCCYIVDILLRYSIAMLLLCCCDVAPMAMLMRCCGDGGAMLR